MLQQIVAGNVYIFLLLFCRLGAVLMSLPGIGEASVPARVKLSIALLMAGLLVPVLGPTLPPMPSQPFLLGFLILTEIGFGLAFGMIARMMMSALQVAGTVIASQAGLAAAMFFDPNQGGQTAVLSGALVFMGTMLIFATDLHLVLLQGMVDSYRLFPPLRAPAYGDFAEVAQQMVSSSFSLGMRMAAPFIVYGIVFNVALGLLNRLMPTLQIFFIMQAPQIAMSFLLFGFSLAAIGLLFTTQFEELAAQFLLPR
ncbi:flagellar biosynthetic protein FliR [Ferrovibrio sp.]|uniref:flagellar biosynthetic protein FliR n=1 Tax=Ferrovibrio sp. TaxID=1917215 RepID=UPI0025B92D37|nr:flagellar biosynthetic protein FliR [Ferrovibrio sp.]MBX3455528.1 flagellar type III secretion system protein FliR [Ferrovibrio sp.]